MQSQQNSTATTGNGSEWRKVPTEGDTNNAEESQPAFTKETS